MKLHLLANVVLLGGFANAAVVKKPSCTLLTTVSSEVTASSTSDPFDSYSTIYTDLESYSDLSPEPTGVSVTKEPYSTTYTDPESFPFIVAQPTRTSIGYGILPTATPTRGNAFPRSDAAKPVPFDVLNKRYSTTMQSILAASNGTCSTDNVFVRRSWSKLTDDERKAYLKAVSCMHGDLPNKIKDTGMFTRASRFRIDDFIIPHSYWSFYNIYSGVGLHWNRALLSLYEQTLRDDCRYEGGTLPYWDFSQDADDITKASIFSNDATSMGGNGAEYPHSPVQVTYFSQNITVPPGSGGGCIYDAPFKGTTVRLGLPLKHCLNQNETVRVYPWPLLDGWKNPAWDFNTPTSPYNHNDRCILRDLNADIGKNLSLSRIESDLSCKDVACLNARLNGAVTGEAAYPFNTINTALFAVGGLQLDPMTAPADPIYWLIMANIDRFYSIWQAQDPASRFNQVNGTRTPFNELYDFREHVNDPINLGPLLNAASFYNGTVTIGNFTNSLNEMLCYYYD